VTGSLPGLVKELAVRKRLKLAKERAVVLKSRKTAKEKRKVAKKRIAVARNLQRRIVAATRVRVKGIILILPSTKSGEREL